jgi:hypothetical protein
VGWWARARVDGSGGVGIVTSPNERGPAPAEVARRPVPPFMSPSSPASRDARATGGRRPDGDATPPHQPVPAGLHVGVSGMFMRSENGPHTASRLVYLERNGDLILLLERSFNSLL